MRGWVHAFKYPERGLAGLDPGPRATLAELIRSAARRAPGPRPALLVPIPLHPTRLRARGFNPAALLARELAKSVSAPLATRVLERTRATRSQTGLTRRERRYNVEGAFAVRRGTQLPPRIWLVDDVVTTGATLAAAATALRSAGAREVSAVCAARTLRASEAVS